jgi:hypothetical protein
VPEAATLYTYYILYYLCIKVLVRSSESTSPCKQASTRAIKKIYTSAISLSFKRSRQLIALRTREVENEIFEMLKHYLFQVFL